MRTKRSALGAFAIICLAAIGGLAFAFLYLPGRVAYTGTLLDAAVAPIPRTIEAAESEGAVWAVSTAPSTQPGNHASEFAAPMPRRCAEVDSIGPVRSGEFFAGGLLRRVGTAGRPKLWWRPMHPARSYDLTVRGSRIDGSPDTLRYVDTSLEIASEKPLSFSGSRFYAAGITIPSSGRWLVVATSGPDWGCFILPGPAARGALTAR